MLFPVCPVSPELTAGGGFLLFLRTRSPGGGRKSRGLGVQAEGTHRLDPG